MAAASHPFFGLCIEQGDNWHRGFEKKQENIIKEDSQRIDFIPVKVVGEFYVKEMVSRKGAT
jgi:hypothetical protein